MPLGVGMLAGVFPPFIGGIQIHTLQLARRLVEHGVEVHVLTRHHRDLPRQERMEGVCVHRVGDANLPRGIRAASYLFGALATLCRLRDHIQLLHAHQLMAPALIGYLGRAMLGKPLVLNPHSPAEVAQLKAQGASGRLQLAAARRFGDAFVSICKPITVELLGAGMDERRIHFIPNGVDTRVFHPANPSERAELRRALGLSDSPMVVYAGRLSYVKGIDVLLEAWPHLEDRAQLCIVGDGEDAAALREQAARLRGVRFVGPVGNPAPFLRAADIAVMPSRSEGLSIALLEAMSCGLSTVATAVGGSPDAIDDGVDGLLVPPEDPPALAAALIRALETPSMGLAARARIVECHSIDRVADRVVALYRALCPAPRGYFSLSPATSGAAVATADLPSTARTVK
jgi:glycosyltransferase involved in cell wall biosynthesis